MKIVILTCADSIHTVRWANAYANLGHDVILIANGDHREMKDQLDEKVQIRYLKHGGVLAYYLNAPELRKMCCDIAPDVINVCYASGYGTLARMARLKDIAPVVLSVWGSDVYDVPNESKLKRNIVKNNLLYADRIASTSYSMAEHTKSIAPGLGNIAITPFGVDISKFAPMSKDHSSSFRVGVVKKLEAKYGIDTVIRAYAIFRKQVGEAEGIDFSLDIYGKGSQLEYLKNLTNEVEVSFEVNFHGYVANTEIPRLLNDMDVFCVGSTLDSESFGVAVVEAMSCGVPVVATKVSGFKEVMIDSKTGYLVNIDDVKAMADCIHLLYRDVELRKSIGENARLHVVKEYDWNENVQRMVRLLEEIAHHE